MVVAFLSVRRYPRQLFNQEWKVKPCKCRQRKPWNKYELFDVLGQAESVIYSRAKVSLHPG